MKHLLHNLLLLVAGTLPLAQVGIRPLGIPVYIPEILITASLIVYGYGLFRKRSAFHPIPLSIRVGGGLFLTGAILSSVFSGISTQELGALKSWIVFPMLYGLLVSKSFRTRSESEKLLLAWFIGMVVVALISLSPFSFVRETYDGRLASFYPSPNHLALFLEPGILLGTYFLFSAWTKYRLVRHFALFLSGTVVLVTVVSMTDSSGAAIAVLIGIGMYAAFLLLSKKVTLFLLGILIACAVLFSAGIFPDVDRERFGSGEIRTSFASRVMIWNVSDALVRKSPVFGIGLRNFEREYLAAQPDFPPYLEWAVPHPQSLMLAVRLYTGVSGLIGFAMISVFVAYSAWSRIFSEASHLERSSSSFLLATLLIIFVHGLVDVPMFKNDLSIVFFMIIGLFVTQGIGSKPVPNRKFLIGEKVDGFFRRRDR